MYPVLPLNKGQYLAPEYKLFGAEGITIGVTEFKNKIPTGIWHSHENALISFALKGGDIEKRKGLEMERLPGLVTFYHSNEPHQNVYKVFPSKRMNIEIEPLFFQKYNLNENLFHLAIKKNRAAKFKMFKIYKELLFNDNYSPDSVHLLLLALISTAEKIKNNNHPRWVVKVEEILNDNWNKTISLEQLSLETHIHPVSISKHFVRYFGSSLGEYIRGLRISKGIQMMHNSSLSLTEVAFECGFSDQSHFIRVFKKHTGFLPSQYQRL